MNMYKVLECTVIGLGRLSPWRPPPPDGWRVSSVRCTWIDPGAASQSGGAWTSDSVFRNQSIYESSKVLHPPSPLPGSTTALQKVDFPLSPSTPDKLRLMEEVPGINSPPCSVSNGLSAE